MGAYNQLDEIDGHRMTEAEAKELYIENIADESYQTLKEQLAMNLDQRSLLELVSETHKHELRLEQRRTNKQRVRRQGVAFGLVESNPNPSKRTRRAQTSSAGTSKLPSKLHPNLEGFLYVKSDLWETFDADSKQFVTNYNRAHRHKTALPTAPAGTTIGEKKDDGRGNVDIGRAGRPRRVCRVTDNLSLIHI